MSCIIRPLTPPLAETADEIMMAAFGKNEPRLQDLLRILKLQPDGYFLAYVGSEPVGMGGAMIYGPFAYVGMLAVHPNYQRRGIARTLMEHILDWLKQRAAPAVWLDASAKGFPLYVQLGFTDIEDAGVFAQLDSALIPPPPASVRPLKAADWPDVLAFDAPVFGADRSRLLQALFRDYPAGGFVARAEDGRLSGYILSKGRRIGPWVAERPEDAEGLLQAALQLPADGARALVLPAANRDAADLLRRYGFQWVSACRHMRLGEAPTTQRREWIYAQTSYALG